MKKSKKIFLLTVMVTLLLLCFAFGASAESHTYGDFIYELTESHYGYNDLVIITGYSGEENSVTIPSKIDGYDVVMISENAFNGNQNIVEIVVPSTVIYVDEEAFEGCTALEVVTIEGYNTFIMTYAFRNCTALNNIYIKGKNVHIGGFAFYNTAFWNDESNWEEGLLYLDNYLLSADPTAVDGKLEISEGTLGIAGGAFQNCAFLTEVVIPEGTTVIGEGCFGYCVALREVSLASTVSFIDYGAFEGCVNLKSINIPKSTAYIGEDAFSSCFSLESIEIQNSITVLGEKSIGYTYYTVSDLERYVEIVQEGLIKSNNGEDTTELENELHSLINICTEYKEGSSIFTCRFGSYTFENAVVTDIIMGVPEINGVNGSTAQTYAEENGLDFIAVSTEESFNIDFAYTFNPAYTEIIITGYTGSKENVVIPSEIEGIEVVGIGMAAFSDENSENFQIIKSVVIPDTVTKIGKAAFMECLNLQNINIPDGVTSIDEACFAHCFSLKSLEIPDTVTKIGTGAFLMCLSLEDISIPDNVESIDDLTFSYCFSLNNIEIPNAVTKIGADAFSYCFSLENLELQDSIESVGAMAFYNCLLLDNAYIYSKDVEIDEKTFGFVDTVIDETKISKKEFVEKYCEALKYSIMGQTDEFDAIRAEIEDCMIMYDEPLVNVSCTIYGYTASTAHVYADENVINFIPLDSECEHENTEIKNAKSATCTEEGYTGDTYCMACSEKIETGTVIEKLGHSHIPKVTTEATCTEEGVLTYSCSCGDSYTEKIEKIAHTEVIDKAVAASCTETGLTEGKHCSTCGTVIVEQYIVEKTAHTEVIDKAVAASCTETGLTEGKHCSACGTVIVEQYIVEKTAHTEVIDKAVVASCSGTGLTEGKHCSACGTVIIEQSIISATGHKFSNYKSNNDAACESDGTKTAFCDNGCGVKDTVIDKGSAIGHKYGKDGICISCSDYNKSYDENIKTDNCSCNCHKNGFMSFIWKILLFFYKLFKINPVCDCGIAHY